MRRPAWAILLLFCGCPRPLPPQAKALPPPIQIPAGCEASLTGEWRHLEDPSFRYHFQDDGTEATVWVYRVFAAIDAGTHSRLFPRPGRDAGALLDAGQGADGGQPLDGGAALDAGPARDAGSPPDGGSPAQASAADRSTLAHHHPLPVDLIPLDGGTPPLATAVIHLRRTADGFLGEAETLHLLPSGRECRATFATRIAACSPATLNLVSATSTPIGEGCQTPSLPRPAALLEHRLARIDAGEL